MDTIIIINIVVVLVAVVVGLLCNQYARMRGAVVVSQLEQERERVQALTSECERLTKALTDEKIECARLLEKCDGLQRNMEQQQADFEREDERRREEFRQQLELVKSQLKNETQQVNRESIVEILKPYREQLEELSAQHF